MMHQQLTMDPERLQVMIDLLPQVDDLLPHLKSVEGELATLRRTARLRG